MTGTMTHKLQLIMLFVCVFSVLWAWNTPIRWARFLWVIIAGLAMAAACTLIVLEEFGAL